MVLILFSTHAAYFEFVLFANVFTLFRACRPKAAVQEGAEQGGPGETVGGHRGPLLLRVRHRCVAVHEMCCSAMYHAKVKESSVSVSYVPAGISVSYTALPKTWTPDLLASTQNLREWWDPSVIGYFCGSYTV